ncbi:EAL domain-containing protein [Thalassomonas actiniarum]|uniref:EAL domain-containing protein n=1 Tax=Thalassomonas actiniarum TaxID=485447 RepID=A0AAE9YP43_9GAMM|nr:EAL domain-containing protein [Thalassomonas actiniarum]WDD97022.1 EAL domain-containing protein [Thalassomonas actiniarum]
MVATNDRLNVSLSLSKHEQLYRQMFEKNQAIKLIIDPAQGRILEANEAALRFYGYDKATFVGMLITELNTLTEEEVKQEMLLAKKEARVFHNFRHRLASGDIRDVEVYSGPITVEDKTFLYSIILDVTRRKKAEQALLETEQRQRDLLNNTSSVIYTKDLSGHYLSINRAYELCFDVSESEIQGKTDFDLFPEEVARKFRRNDLKAINLNQPVESEETVLTANKRQVFLSVKFPLKNARGEIYAVCGISTDITQRKLAEEKIQHQAHYDALTRLPNRFLALERLAQMLNEAQRSGHQVAVLFIDLDDFKKINDSLGHEVGDKVLVEAAGRLQGVIRQVDVVGRLGGDEFIILLGGLSGGVDAKAIVEKMLQQFHRAFYIDSRELILTATAGIAVYPEDGRDSSTLLRNADMAMYQAKALGRNTYSYFNEKMNRDVSRRLELEQAIRGALQRQEFEVVYQVQVKVNSGEIIGAEALLRWYNPKLGQVSPVEFIPIAEQTGLIIDIGQFVLTQALSVLASWQQRHHRALKMSVNLSPRQFRDIKLVDMIEQALIQAGVAANCLELEITEGVLMSGHSYIKKTLSALSVLGIYLSMDDFGTGYSSLNYLRQYPFDVLKIDRSFVQGITTESTDRKLVNAAIAMAHGLNLTVVAEGVETQEQLHLLKSLNCDFAQGYLLGKPCRAKQLLVLELMPL